MSLVSDNEFSVFLGKITAFIWTYAITNPGVNSLRAPVYAEMINIVNNQPVEFSDYKFDLTTVRKMIDNFGFYNQRPITKAILTWWAYQSIKQPLLSLETTLEIEHIYARNRYEKEKSLSNPTFIELLGNKSLLEKHINIRASDYRFSDKVVYYRGYINKRKQAKQGTKMSELLEMANCKTDYTESDILDRNSTIIDAFIEYLRANKLER